MNATTRLHEFLARRIGRDLRGCAAATGIAAMLLASASHGISFTASLSGAAESTPNASPATGTAVVTLYGTLMLVQVTFSGLTSPTTDAHIHCCTPTPNTGTAIVATTTPTFTGFPAGVTSGTYEHSFDILLASTYNPAFITASGGTVTNALGTLFDYGLYLNKAYLNIHTSSFPGGEIRGFLTPEGPPAFTKSFNPSSTTLGQPVSLTFTLTNPNTNALPMTNIGFLDNLPLGLGVAPGITNACGGVLTTTTNSIALGGASIALNGQCQFTVPLTQTNVGTFSNTTDRVQGDTFGNGNFASATLQILPAPMPVSIPTLGPWLLAGLVAVMGIGAFAYTRRRV